MIGCEAFQVIGPSRLSSGMNVSRYCDQPCRNLFDFDAIHYIKIATLMSLLCSSTLLSDLQRNAWERNVQIVGCEASMNVWNVYNQRRGDQIGRRNGGGSFEFG
jgi:hypothetical protein